MKRLIRILIFTLCIVVLLCLSASATGQSEEIKEYVGEKIMPVIAGVVTSLLALLGTLKSIFKSLRDLKSSKEDLNKAQNEIKDQSERELEAIKLKYDEIKALLSDVPELKADLEKLLKGTSTLICQMSRLSKISSLGFLQNSEVVRSGRGKEIACLAEQNQEVENEAS